MLTEGGERSRSHGLARMVLEAQAAALGVPLVIRAASWDGYTEAFVHALAGLLSTSSRRLSVPSGWQASSEDELSEARLALYEQAGVHVDQDVQRTAAQLFAGNTDEA